MLSRVPSVISPGAYHSLVATTLSSSPAGPLVHILPLVNSDSASWRVRSCNTIRSRPMQEYAYNALFRPLPSIPLVDLYRFRMHGEIQKYFQEFEALPPTYSTAKNKQMDPWEHKLRSIMVVCEG